eukprot:5915417-Pyramimonas_sp.AAC.1
MLLEALGDPEAAKVPSDPISNPERAEGAGSRVEAASEKWQLQTRVSNIDRCVSPQKTPQEAQIGGSRDAMATSHTGEAEARSLDGEQENARQHQHADHSSQ